MIASIQIIPPIELILRRRESYLSLHCVGNAATTRRDCSTKPHLGLFLPNYTCSFVSSLFFALIHRIVDIFRAEAYTESICHIINGAPTLDCLYFL
jgi:hypothetical protein